MATLSRLTGHVRRVTAFVLSRFVPDADMAQLDAWLASLPTARRWAITGSVLGVLLILALIAAAFGPLGLAVYFVAIVLIFR